MNSYYSIFNLNVYYLINNYESINCKICWIKDKNILPRETEWYPDTFLFNKYDKATGQSKSDNKY